MTNEILSVINAGETGTTEFKTTFQKEVIETEAAFANAKGGQILIGVSDAMQIKCIVINRLLEALCRCSQCFRLMSNCSRQRIVVTCLH
jgi:predicted HTH transcriptional regulator